MAFLNEEKLYYTTGLLCWSTLLGLVFTLLACGQFQTTPATVSAGDEDMRNNL